LILKALRGLYEYFWMYAGLLYLGAIGLVYSSICSLLYLILGRAAPAHTAKRISALVLRGLFRMLIASGMLRVDLSVLQALRGRGGILIAPNHPSLLDAAHHLALPGGRLHHEGADLGQPGAGRRRTPDGLHPQ